MRSEDELVARANENLIASFAKVAEHSFGGHARYFGGVFAFVTGLEFSLFNGCIVVGPVSSRDLESALRWLDAQQLPFRVWVSEELVASLEDVLRGGLICADPVTYPGMVLHPACEPAPPAAGVTVVPVGSDVDQYVQIVVDGGVPENAARRLYSHSFVADPDVRLFLGRLEEEPVGTSVAIRSARAGGLVAVGTLPAARRRGVGTALSWAAVGAAREWGRDTVVLQSSAMAVSMYEAMGFRTVVPYAVFSGTA